MIHRFLALFAICLSLRAQTNRINSPEVLSDRKVTFRLDAPKASEARLFADWMDTNSREKMTKDANGVWSITVGPIDPGIYIYNFVLDGLAIADPINPQMKLRARTSASLLEVRGNSELWEARDVPHGDIEIVNHKSPVLNGETRQAWIYTPPGYHESRKRYPVLYLLHGSNDTPAGWTMVGRAHFIMDNLLAEKKAREFIIVMPFGHAVPFDAPRDQQQNNTALFEDYLLKDLAPLVEKKYRIQKGRENHAIVGLSMGGGQSLQIGLTHLDQFSAVGAFSSAIPRNFETKFADLLNHPDQTNKKLNLLWIGCGRQDPGFQGSQNLSKVLDTHQIKHTFHPTEGRHTYTVWRQYFSEVAPLLFQAK